MTSSTKTFDGYIGKFASPTKEGTEEVFEFLSAAGRSAQVYARLYEKVEESVLAGLFWGIWKQTPNEAPMLISTSAIFLHGKDQIAITQNQTHNQEYGTYVEHGATLRRKEREGVENPKGVFLQILMAAPLVQFFSLLGQAMPNRQARLMADVIVDNVQQGAQSDYVRNFIRNVPHNWEELQNPSLDLLRRFESSVDDPNINRAKDFNRFFISSIPSMAQIVLNALDTGSLTAEYKGTTYVAAIDLSHLPATLKRTLPVIVKNKNFFEQVDKRTSFAEVRRLFEKYLVIDNLERLSQELSDDVSSEEASRVAQTLSARRA